MPVQKAGTNDVSGYGKGHRKKFINDLQSQTISPNGGGFWKSAKAKAAHASTCSVGGKEVYMERFSAAEPKISLGGEDQSNPKLTMTATSYVSHLTTSMTTNKR